ncbi:sugar transferase [Firmicutes bacterium AM31-12AC]|nr:sugar transferase [Firmicutes bacterium AM43-11BH]RHT36390.1 sugar transferase [Firmicutes bacterium AM31-12AC]
MYKNVIKRIIGFLFSLIALPFLIIVIVVLAPIIYIDDPGPVFYVSKRAGKYGKIFNMLKFRSMKVNSPNLLNSDGSTYNSASDSRQTRVGKVIRKLSIDELPQILNVLKGDMAWIGPRPVLDSQLLTFTEEERGKLEVLPGITGYTQAYNRNELQSHDERMMDAWYAKNVSFFLDVKIFFKTIETVLHPDRVYKNK